MEECKQRESVVLIHGLWMRGLEMIPLQRRLEAAGYFVTRFHYKTASSDLLHNVNSLRRFLGGVPDETIHFVCHSMGGLLIRLFFDRYPEFIEQHPGRVVTLGSPHRGSFTARRLARLPFWHWMFGKAFSTLNGEVPPWSGVHSLASFSGDLSIGAGWFVRDIPSPNDGTVGVEETRLDGMSEHRIYRASHMGLLFSPSVARDVIAFLQDGTIGEKV